MWAMADLREKLKRDEDAEEQGLLLRLPCKVGDTVWVVTSPFNVFDDIEYDENMKDEVYEAFISSVTFYECGEQYRIYAKATNHFIGAYFRKCDYKRGSRSQAERNGGRKWRVDIYIAESGLITASGWKVVLLPEYFFG